MQHHKLFRFVLLAGAFCAVLLLTACGQGGGGNPSPRGSSEPPSGQGFGRSAARLTDTSQKQRQAEFLNRLRHSDPRYQTIEKAVLNENNDLGLILSRSVPMDSIPNLMRTMLTQMAAEFPGQDLTVVAYAPTQPPTRIGTAKLDARTRQMFYTPTSSR